MFVFGRLQVAGLGCNVNGQADGRGETEKIIAWVLIIIYIYFYVVVYI